MKKKIVYQLDCNGIYVGEAYAYESPLEPNVFHIPAGCVEDQPPTAKDGHIQVFKSGEWKQMPVPAPESIDSETGSIDYRAMRDELLRETDIPVLRFLETGLAVPDILVSYRQALRDIPQQEGFPENINWPEKPSLME